MRFSTLILVSLLLPEIASSSEIDFNRDVRPILSDKCFKCHGPDAKNQKSDFRIDTFDHATTDLGDYAGIVPGDLKASETHWRLHSTDPIDQMPPPEAKMPLTPREIAILDQWIEEGAEYDAHWSFVPLPETIETPEVETDWVKNEIDYFIHAKLDAEGFSPQPETTREKWLRRITFDLTGLPPTIAEIDAFLADRSEGAYEKVVDRLFDMPAYGERLAMEWMNVARYSDTYGFQVDRDRFVWPWRDWVIRAFEGGMPYDQFITEQLAGDLLPDATRDQILATTFNRLNPQKVEGGSVPEEFRVEYVSDRLHTYGTAFLGLTMECSRCHDHKYDPITAADYYSLSSFFANIDEAGLYSYFTKSTPTPALNLPTSEQETTLWEIEREIAKAEAKIEKKTEPVAPIASFHFDSGDYTNSVAEGAAAKSPAANQFVASPQGKAVRLTGDDGVTLPVGNFTRDDPFSITVRLKTPDRKERAVILSRSKAWTDAASRGYELLIEEGRLGAALVHFEPGDGIRIRATTELPVGSWHTVTMTYDGSSRASGLQLHLDGKTLETEIISDKLTREITGGGSDTIVIGQRMRDNGFQDGLIEEISVYDREIDPATGLAYARDGSLHALRKKRSDLIKEISSIMVMREMAEPRQSYLLDRGLYSERTDEVESTTPEWLNPFPEDAPRNRLGLAQWTVSPDNPLTARVTVNRYWQMFFGRGLVSTTEDFGAQGKIPTHPALLDWLARDFIASGWDLRDLFKKIALSATYRQSSNLTSGEFTERDPENTLLYRFPAPRLSAEQIRDNALAVSGLLVRETGGPSVKPYDIAVSFKPVAHDKGDGLYRRSLYTYWRQTAPAPLMTTLNASKRDVCRVRLEKTDTPLQGLVLFNSPQFHEASEVLSKILTEKHRGDRDAIITDAFRRLTSRVPDEAEQKILTRLLTEQSELTSLEEATTALVSTLLNFDETITKR